MSSQPDLDQLTVSELADLCAREAEAYFRGRPCDARYGYELFRRAIAGRDESAWEAVYRLYLPLATGWTRRHPLFAATGEEAQYFVAGAFGRMWSALTPAKFDRFPDLKAVLRYLQMCVHSAVIDYARNSRPAVEPIRDEPAFLDEAADGSSVETQALDQVDSEALWRAVFARLHDDKERHTLYGCFVLDLKPRELHDQFRDVFADVEEVYRVKQNVLARLRRDPELAKLVAAGV